MPMNFIISMLSFCLHSHFDLTPERFAFRYISFHTEFSTDERYGHDGPLHKNMHTKSADTKGKFKLHNIYSVFMAKIQHRYQTFIAILQNFPFILRYDYFLSQWSGVI